MTETGLDISDGILNFLVESSAAVDRWSELLQLSQF